LAGLARFQAKWRPVRVKRTRQIKNLEPRFALVSLIIAMAGAGAFTFEHFAGTKVRHASRARWGNRRPRRGKFVSEVPVILVVEDEYPLQGIVEEALIDGGFETDILSSGEEALTLFRGWVKNYRALVTDVNLKGMTSGWEVARHVREIDPGFPVIYMTGVAADQWASQGVPNSILLQKPFAPAQLVTAVSQLLNAGSAPP
jgi:CheY-like chemotaxis protein